MRFELFLALRYLRAPRRPHAARITTLASIVGIACGVAAYILASALANGFQNEVRDKILQGTAHITITSIGGVPAIDERAVLPYVERTDGVRSASLTTYQGALLIGDAASLYAVVRGVDSRRGNTLDELRRTLVAGRIADDFAAARTPAAQTSSATNDELPIIVGARLAEATGLSINSVAQIVVAAQARSADGAQSIPLPRSHRARVVGIFRLDLHDYDATWVYAPLRSAVRLGEASDVGGAVSGAGTPPAISVETTNAFTSDEVAARIRTRLGAGWRVVTWGQAHGALFAALKLENQVVGFIISLVTIIAGLNILTTLVLLVAERRRQIAIFSALGARARSISLIFIIEGTIIGITGALAGLLLGLAGCCLGNYYDLVRLPADVYAINRVPFHPRAADAILACAVALLISLLATLYPARRAARVHPATALREEA